MAFMKGFSILMKLYFNKSDSWNNRLNNAFEKKDCEFVLKELEKLSVIVDEVKDELREVLNIKKG